MAEKAITRRLKIFINGNEVDATLTNLRKSLVKFKAQSNAAVEGTPEWKKYNEEVARTEAELLQATAAQKKFREETGLGVPNLKETGSWLDKIKTKLGPVATGFIAAFSIGAVVTAAFSALKGAVKTINEFEQSVADLQAITGAAGDDLEYLKTQAITLGAETKGGAIAVVEAYKLIASAKPELLENVEALNMVTEATLTLAQAAGMEMPAAATALTDAMNQFGADASQASVFVDALANGAKYGAAEIPDITEAVLKFGAVSRTSNIDIKESVALVELLAENGIKGTEAGTKLRNVLLKISAPDALPKEAQATFERLGISMEFLNDKTIPLQQKLEALKPLLKNNADIIEVFGLENATAAINVIEHTDRIGELTSKMGEVGTATEQASIKMNTVAGKTELLKGKYDSFILTVSNGGGVISKFFKFWIDGASSALDGLTRLNSSWDELYARAQGDGTAKGVKSFAERFNNLAGTGNDAEVAKSVKEAARETLYILKKSYEENEAAIDAFNPWKFNFSGISPKDMKEKKEQLTKEIAAYNSIIAEANKKINSFENPVSTTGGTVEEPKPGEGTKTTGTGSKTKKDKTDDPAITPEDQKIIDSKKKVAEFLAQWDADQAIQKQLKDLEASEAAQLKEELEIENKYNKLEEQAANDTALLVQLKEAEQTELDAVSKKWNDKFWNDNKKNKAKIAETDKQYKEAIIKSEEDLQAAKADMLFAGLGLLRSFVKEGSVEYKALFAIEKIMAAVEVILAGQRERAAYAANPVWSAMPDGGAVIKANAILASKIRTGVSLATIAATAIKGFSGGGDTSPFGLGYKDKSGHEVAGVVHTGEYVIPRFVRKDPEVPQIIEYLEAKRTGKETASNIGTSNNSDLQSVLAYNTGILSEIKKSISDIRLNYTLDDERERQLLQKKLDNTINASKK